MSGRFSTGSWGIESKPAITISRLHTAVSTGRRMNWFESAMGQAAV
ncbi:hypothetical protein [Cyanobium sp. Morenito 9A2]|nr:hypothetical protein [Cyanobium sp. Morenito 9A2]